VPPINRSTTVTHHPKAFSRTCCVCVLG
jgi:hypothetical protein